MAVLKWVFQAELAVALMMVVLEETDRVVEAVAVAVVEEGEEQDLQSVSEVVAAGSAGGYKQERIQKVVYLAERHS
jgi:hypothetical protein